MNIINAKSNLIDILNNNYFVTCDSLYDYFKSEYVTQYEIFYFGINIFK